MSSLILHIAQRADWLRAEGRGAYRCASLQDEGFIHCSCAAQVLIPANERFRGREDLLLLVIDASALCSELRYEDCYDSGMAFPHVYGPIELEAVAEVLPFSPGADGLFQLPAKLEQRG